MSNASRFLFSAFCFLPFALADVATFQTFDVQEATIADIHAAMRAKKLTCRALVEAYLKRIELYDKQGPALNAIVVVNPNAVKEAEAMDRRFAQGGMAGPLHCIPMIVKDNFETIGLQSANGSLALAGFVSTKDAFQVKRIKEAGAIVLAKSNMAEWAFTPNETLSSILPGYTKNPYALDRVTAGSSGGTAAAVTASFGAAGLGSDTGNSIRGPSSHQALVGIRSTMGLTSRAGVTSKLQLAAGEPSGVSCTVVISPSVSVAFTTSPVMVRMSASGSFWCGKLSLSVAVTIGVAVSPPPAAVTSTVSVSVITVTPPI